jgi:hypothetical protein
MVSDSAEWVVSANTTPADVAANWATTLHTWDAALHHQELAAQAALARLDLAQRDAVVVAGAELASMDARRRLTAALESTRLEKAQLERLRAPADARSVVAGGLAAMGERLAWVASDWPAMPVGAS